MHSSATLGCRKSARRAEARRAARGDRRREAPPNACDLARELGALRTSAERAQIQPYASRSSPFSHAAEVHAELEHDKNLGKISLVPDGGVEFVAVRVGVSACERARDGS